MYVRDTLGSTIQEEPKKFWSFIKRLNQENFGVADLEKDGKIVSEDPQKANILNDQFQSVFTAEPVGNVTSLGESPYTQIEHLTVTKAGVEKLLEGSKSTSHKVQTAFHLGF